MKFDFVIFVLFYTEFIYSDYNEFPNFTRITNNFVFKLSGPSYL